MVRSRKSPVRKGVRKTWRSYIADLNHGVDKQTILLLDPHTKAFKPKAGKGIEKTPWSSHTYRMKFCKSYS